MPRAAWILVLVALGVLVVALLAAAFVVAAGSDDEPEVVALEEASGRLELPLADDEATVTRAAHKGRVLVGIAAKVDGPIQVAAVEGEQAVAESDLRFTVDGRRVTPSSCGYACSELDVAGARELVVSAPEAFRFDLPAQLPPSGAALFAAATRTMEALRTYRFDEELTSGLGSGVRSTWEAQAPDRVGFRTAEGSRSIIVGKARWDFRDGRWERTPYPGIKVPTYMWDGAGNARILGRARGNRILSVFDRDPVPAWFRLTVDNRSRVLDAEMLAPSHFMRQRFRDFNAPIRIKPPA
jgi:hypothetical protein